MTHTLKLTGLVRMLALLPLLGLCLVLTGCADLVANMATPQGMMNVSGYVTAMNATDRTVEIKTDGGETLVISVADNTKLTKPVQGLLMESDEAITIGDIQVGKYMEVTCSKEPVDGKHAATYGEMYNSKLAAKMYN